MYLIASTLIGKSPIWSMAYTLNNADEGLSTITCNIGFETNGPAAMLTESLAVGMTISCSGDPFLFTFVSCFVREPLRQQPLPALV